MESIMFMGFGLPVFIAVEAIVFWRVFGWSSARATVASVLANIFAVVVLFFAFVALYRPVENLGAVTGLYGWRLAHWWVPLTLLLWCSLLAGSVLTKSSVFALIGRWATPRQSYGRTLRLTAVVNLVLYVVALPLWLCMERPHVDGARLVDRSRWAPAIDGAFLYTTPEGEMWIANLKGQKLAEVGEAPPQPLGARLAYTVSDDGRSLLVLFYGAPRFLGYDQEPWFAPPPKETVVASFDLDLLPASYRESLVPGAQYGVPGLAEAGYYDDEPRSHTRDGTIAQVSPKCRYLWIETGATSRANGQPWPETASIWIGGSPGLSSFFGFWSPHVLPGGRYVLFSCSGEIMVLDVETRDIVRLLPGYEPVALTSLVPPEKNADAGDTPENAR